MGKAETIKKLDELIAGASVQKHIAAVGELLKAAVTEETAELVSTHLNDGGLEGAFALVEKYATANHGKAKCFAVSSDEAVKIIFDAWALPAPSELAEPTAEPQAPAPTPTEHTEQVDAAPPKKKLRRISLDD